MPMTDIPSPRVVLVESDYELRGLLKHVFEQAACEVVELQNGRDLLSMLESPEGGDSSPAVDLIVCDARALVGSVLHRAGVLQCRQRSPPWILIASPVDSETQQAVEQLQPIAVIDQPFDANSYIFKVRMVVWGQLRYGTFAGSSLPRYQHQFLSRQKGDDS